MAASLKYLWRGNAVLLSSSSAALPSCRIRLTRSHYRSISATAHAGFSWFEKIKGVFSGKSEEETQFSNESFTLLRFADQMRNARRLGKLKEYVAGRTSEATISDVLDKQESIIRCLSSLDPTGENLLTSQKQEAAKQCNCTVADIESTLAKFTWAKEAEKKLRKLKEEGKPMPKSMEEVQKLMDSMPHDIAMRNLAKSGLLSRNALCPCGSKKRYKRCCAEK